MPEIEIKLRVADLSGLQSAVEDLGWKSQGRLYERNTLYDTASRDLLRQDKLLRVRETGGKTILTAKGPSQGGLHKVRDEHEIEASDAGALADILAAADFQPVWVYEKRRTKFKREGEPGVIEVDETPIGNFVELEGPPEWIDRTAALLGFSESDYVTVSYRDLFLEWKQASGSTVGDMVFESDSRASEPHL